MAGTRVNYKLFRGSTDKNLTVTLTYTYENEGDFRTVMYNSQYNSYSISPLFGISISKGYEKDRIYVTSNQYYSFTTLMEKAVKLISDHLYEIFPNVGLSEFDIDAKTLERFQTEKALACDGITMSPVVFVDETNQCFPGLLINTIKYGSIRLPLQDAIAISRLLSNLNPHAIALSLTAMATDNMKSI